MVSGERGHDRAGRRRAGSAGPVRVRLKSSGSLPWRGIDGRRWKPDVVSLDRVSSGRRAAKGGMLEGARGPRGRISGAGVRSHRRQAGPVRKTVEVLLSGAVGMALVGILLALLHVGSAPPASADQSPSPGSHATATAPAALPGPASGQGSGIGGATGVAGSDTQSRSGAAAAAHQSTAPVPQSTSLGGASASAGGSRGASPSAAPGSSSPAPGLVGGAVGGVVGGVAGLVGQLVGGLSGGGGSG